MYALDKSNDSQNMMPGPAASVSPVKYKFLGPTAELMNQKPKVGCVLSSPNDSDVD